MYRYTLTAQGSLEPFVRWEYVKNPPGTTRWCRHHVQGPMDLQVAPGRAIGLNAVHLPTGFVPIEEVLRFCIVELGVRPRTTTWHDTLKDSYQLFKGDFAPGGSTGTH